MKLIDGIHSPLEITMLLHIYAQCDEIPNKDCSAQSWLLRSFVEKGWVTEGSEYPRGYELTDMGRQVVSSILNVKYFGDDDAPEVKPLEPYPIMEEYIQEYQKVIDRMMDIVAEYKKSSDKQGPQ